MSINRFQQFTNPGQITVNPYQLPFQELAYGLNMKQGVQDTAKKDLDLLSTTLGDIKYRPEDEDLVYNTTQQLYSNIDEISQTDLTKNKEGVNNVKTQVRNLLGPKGQFREVQANYAASVAYDEELKASSLEQWYKQALKQTSDKLYEGGVSAGKSYSPIPIPNAVNKSELAEKYGEGFNADILTDYELIDDPARGMIYKHKTENKTLNPNEVMMGVSMLINNDANAADYNNTLLGLQTQDMTPEEAQAFKQERYNVFQTDADGKVLTDEEGTFKLNPLNPYAEVIAAQAIKKGFTELKVDMDWRIDPWLDSDGAGSSKKTKPSYIDLYNKGTVTGINTNLEFVFVDRSGDEIVDAKDAMTNINELEELYNGNNFSDMLQGKFEKQGYHFRGLNLGEGGLKLDFTDKFPTEFEMNDETHRMVFIADQYSLEEMQTWFVDANGDMPTEDETWLLAGQINDHMERYNTVKDYKEQLFKLAKDESIKNLDTHTLETIQVNEEGKDIKSTSLYKDITNKTYQKSTVDNIRLNSPTINNNTLDSYATLQYNVISNIDNYVEKDILGLNTFNIQNKQDILKAYNITDKQFESISNGVKSKEELKSKLLNLPSAKHLEDAIKKAYYNPIKYDNNENFQKAFEDMKENSAYNYNLFTTLPVGKEFTADQYMDLPAIMKFEQNLKIELAPVPTNDGEGFLPMDKQLIERLNIVALNDMNHNPEGKYFLGNLKVNAGDKLNEKDIHKKISGLSYSGFAEAADGNMYPIAKIIGADGKVISGTEGYVMIKDTQYSANFWNALTSSENPIPTANAIDAIVTANSQRLNGDIEKYEGMAIIPNYKTIIYRGSDLKGNEYKVKAYDKSNRLVFDEKFQNKAQLGIFMNQAIQSELQEEPVEIKNNTDFVGSIFSGK